MKLVSITDICDFQGGTQPPKNQWNTEKLPGYVRMLQIRDFTQSKRTTPEYVKDVKTLKKCAADDVLIGRYGASVGKILTGYAGAYNVAIVRTIPVEKKLNKEFLYYILKSPLFQNFILNVGGRAAQAGFNKSDLKKFKIPEIKLNDQIKIAYLLGNVERLMLQREQQLLQLDEIIKSVFLDMFGDPLQNGKNWDTSSIEYLCDEIIDCPHSTPKYSDEKTGYFCIRSSDIVDGYLNLSSTYQVEKSIFENRIKRYKPKAGDIVYSREGGRLGNAARIVGDNNICLGQRIMLFKTNTENNSDFLWSLLESKSFKSKLQNLIGGAAAPRVNIKDLKKLVVIKPPKSMQDVFSKVIEKVDQLKTHYEKNLVDLKALYGSLSQKAFKGELDLSAVSFSENSSEKAVQDDKKIPSINLIQKKPERINKSLESIERKAKSLEPIERIVKPLMPIEKIVKRFDTFNLTKISPDFSKEKTRKKWLIKLFMEFLTDLDQSSFLSLPDFLEAVQKWIGDFEQENGEPLCFLIDDYDALKSWIFNETRKGTILQIYHEASNSIKFKVSQ